MILARRDAVQVNEPVGRKGGRKGVFGQTTCPRL